MTTTEHMAQVLREFLNQQNMMLERMFGPDWRDQSMGGGGEESDDNDPPQPRHNVNVRGNERKLIANHIKADTFSGDMAKWDEWSFKIKRSINTMNQEVKQMMTVAETKEEDIDENILLPDEVKRRSAELYDILCERCDGEALMIIR